MMNHKKGDKMAFCPDCGNQMSENAKFCMECGAKLNDYSSNGINVEDSIIQRSQVGAASVGNINVNPKMIQNVTNGFNCVICNSLTNYKCNTCGLYICNNHLVNISEVENYCIRIESIRGDTLSNWHFLKNFSGMECFECFKRLVSDQKKRYLEEFANHSISYQNMINEEIEIFDEIIRNLS